MSIEISTQIIHASYAAVINSIDPNANIYDNPNQQGTAYPAWFIVHRAPVEVQRDVGKRYGGNRYTLTYMIDIWYMIQQNIPRLYDQYTQVAEELDSKMDYLPIHGSDAVVHVYDRSWSLELSCLKYSTTLRLRVYRNNPNYDDTTIDVITTDVFLKELFPMEHVYFQNTMHPEFNIRIPNRLITHYGGIVKLPVVDGVYQDSDGKYWQPLAWDIGEFGSEYGPLYNDVTANLLFKPAVFEAYCSSNADINDAVLANDATIQLYDKYGQTIPYNSANTYTLTHAWGKLLDNDEIVEWTQGLINHLYIVDRNSYTFARCMAVSYSGHDIYLSKVEYTMEAKHDEEEGTNGN